MNSPMYSYTSNPHAVSRMGTVHYSRNNGNHSSVPMMPMYAGPGQAIVAGVKSIGAAIKDRVQNMSEEDKQFFKDQGKALAQSKVDQFTAQPTGPTPVQTTTTDPKQQYFTTSTGKSQQAPIRTVTTVAPIRKPTLPVGTRSPLVPQQDTFLEKISKNRFNIVLASSALLLGVILINRRRQQ